MGLNKEEIGELKVGNTIKAIVYNRFNKDEEPKKVIGKIVDKGGESIIIIGYSEGNYNIGKITIRLPFSEVSRSRLTGKASKAVNDYYTKYVDYIKKRNKIEKQIQEEQQKLRQLEGEVERVGTNSTNIIKEVNADKIPSGDKIYEILLNNIKQGKYEGCRVRIQQLSGARFRIEYGSAEFRDMALKHTSMFEEFVGNVYITGEQEDYLKDIERIWHKPTILENKDLPKGQVETYFNAGVDDKYRIEFAVNYTFTFQEKMSESEIEKVVKLIERNCIKRYKIKPPMYW